MREIKFRAWDREHNKMVSSNDLKNQAWNIYASMQTPGSSWSYMQYTGLHDKNNKEIYEGDVVEGQKDFYPRSAIGFEDGSFVLQQAPLARWKVSHFELEVIGNIYENPELLNNK